jgi:nucleoside-diphosphate-sugar epimerase
LKPPQVNRSSQLKIKNNMSVAIYGETGLIGKSLKQQFQSNCIDVQVNKWNQDGITSSWKKLESAASESNLNIDLIWAAGASNNASDESVILKEIELVDNFIRLVSSSSINLRSLNLISSAGSIYAGSKDSFITKDTVPIPNSDYGNSKLKIENKFQDLAKSLNTSLNIYRLTNVFGQRDNLKTYSGLIPNLINANLIRKEINIFVPLFVQQDYIDTDFVAQNIYHNIKGNQSLSSKNHIYCRNQSNSIIEIISLIDKFMGRKTPYVTNAIASSSYRQNNLRFSIKFSDPNMIPINPINLSIKKLISEMVYAKVS